MRYKNGYIDNGQLVNNNSGTQRCPKCNSGNFKETVSREKCNNCGYEVDYWGQGANEIASEFYFGKKEEKKI